MSKRKKNSFQADCFSWWWFATWGKEGRQGRENSAAGLQDIEVKIVNARCFCAASPISQAISVYGCEEQAVLDLCVCTASNGAPSSFSYNDPELLLFLFSFSLPPGGKKRGIHPSMTTKVACRALSVINPSAESSYLFSDE